MADDPDFVPYSQRPEWSDVTPLEAAPGDEGNVVAVKYSKHDRELLSYFRAVVAKVSDAGGVAPGDGTGRDGGEGGGRGGTIRVSQTAYRMARSSKHSFSCSAACKHDIARHDTSGLVVGHTCTHLR
jgi:hypothetical protein